MISISLVFPSVALLRPVRIEIGLPHGFTASRPPWKTVWALHCAMESGELFFRPLGADSLIDKFGFALIAPSLDNGWFINSPCADQADFLTEILESLPDILPLARERSHNSVLGVSMGGFGAMRWAIASQRFANAVSISGIFDANIEPDKAIRKDKRQTALYLALRKNMRRLLLENSSPAPHADFKALLKNENLDFTQFYLFCGEQDYLALPQNLALEKLLADHNCKVQLILSPGGHDNHYWREAFNCAINGIFNDNNRAENSEA